MAIQASKQTHPPRRICRAFAVMLLILTSHWPAMAQDKAAPQTQVVLLGTGTPLPDPERSGPCTAIVVNGTPYLVDVGTGVVRRAAAARNKGVKALEPTNLKIAFITHLHSDHTLGLADVMLTPWIMDATNPSRSMVLRERQPWQIISGRHKRRILRLEPKGWSTRTGQATESTCTRLSRVLFIKTRMSK